MTRPPPHHPVPQQVREAPDGWHVDGPDPHHRVFRSREEALAYCESLAAGGRSDARRDIDQGDQPPMPRT
jgi:hypothetical protein